MFPVFRNTYITANFGPSKYLGDLGGDLNSIQQKMKLDQNTFFFGGSLQRMYKKSFALELGFSTGKLAASDQDIKYKSISDSEYFRFRRNLDFRTTITDFFLQFHGYPFQWTRKNNFLKKMKLQPFGYCGVGIFSFNPQGSYYDPVYKSTFWVDLKPLRTEGQGFAEYPERKEYNLTQFHIPYGYGLSYIVADNLMISLSINNRKLFTDYLDDVSKTYIPDSLFSNYLFTEELIEQSKSLQDKSSLVDPFYKAQPGDIRGNQKKYDAYYNYNLKIALRIAKKSSKKANFIKYDDSELCSRYSPFNY
jgi:hypothetical protein